MHANSVPRRRHSGELKAKVLAACDEPGASISGVALAHGLNTNLVRKWRSGRGVKRAGRAITPSAAITAPAAPSATAEFVAIEMPAPPRAAATEANVAAPIGESLIQIERERPAVPRDLTASSRRRAPCGRPWWR